MTTDHARLYSFDMLPQVIMLFYEIDRHSPGRASVRASQIFEDTELSKRAYLTRGCDMETSDGDKAQTRILAIA